MKQISTPIQALIESPEEINPAVAMNLVLQNLEKKGELHPLTLASMYPQIANAIATGEEQLKLFQNSLQALQNATTSASIAILLGF